MSSESVMSASERGCCGPALGRLKTQASDDGGVEDAASDNASENPGGCGEPGGIPIGQAAPALKPQREVNRGKRKHP